MSQLLSNLPIGVKVKFGKYSVNGEPAQPITWLIVAKNHNSIPAYPNNSVTLLTEKIIDLRCYDAREPNHLNELRSKEGHNRYSISNIDQWLNKDNPAGEWYVSTHSTDTPPSVEYDAGGGANAYAERPAFLHAFSEEEKNAILVTTINPSVSLLDNMYDEVISRRVFLPSLDEIFNRATQDGSVWEYFSNNREVMCGLTEQAYTYTRSSNKPSEISGTWYWWSRTIAPTRASGVMTVYSTETQMEYGAASSLIGVRPALNISSSTLVSDTTDSDGCYVVTFNTAPSVPTTLTIPTIYGGKANTISWGGVTDPDGDSITYQLECSYDGSTFSQIYSGASTAYSHSVTFGTVPVAYRVKATDSKGGSSEYAVAAVPMVVNNLVPVISGADSNLGIKSAEFTETYTITDTDSETVTVTEAVDGAPIRSYVAALGKTNTVSVTGTTWLSLANGVHTLTISATDGIDTTVRTYTFTKSVSTLSIQTKVPMESSTMPTRISIQVTRNIPTDAIFKVEVCNNGFDSSPTWEDATSSVTGIAVHLFENTKKTATKWGVLVRVTVNRNGGEGACYVSAIGGNFE